MNNLGDLYSQGPGGDPQSFAYAAEWYEMAACLDNKDGMANLGKVYYNGRGVPQSNKRALELFSQCAAKEDALGQLFPGVSWEASDAAQDPSIIFSLLNKHATTY